MLRVMTKKQAETCDLIESLERSSVLHPFRLSKMLSPGMLGLATYQTHMFLGLTCS
jgi:hypothetical protein